jgi:DNA (cytosine-5)-methyltransferase 1
MTRAEYNNIDQEGVREATRLPYQRAGLNRPYSVVSFFSGCGGLDLGFIGGFNYKGTNYQGLPFGVSAAYDVDRRSGETYKLNVGDHFQCADLSDIANIRVPAADVLIGGFPCQDFSTCGPRKGLSSERGRLYLALRDYMREYLPRVVVAENVSNLIFMEKGEVLKKIISDLEEPGYRFEYWNLYAPDYGVPQTRNRVFLVGVRDDIEGFPRRPIRTHLNDHPTVDWAISDLEEILDESVPNQSQYFKANKATNGHGQGDEISLRGFPGYTVRANAKSRVQFHYSLPRRLTIRECARLQTFPDDFEFPHPPTSSIRQIGNAVPPVMAYRVARSIANFLERLDNDGG